VAAAAAAAAEINAPGLVINGVETDYKLVPEAERAAAQNGGNGGSSGSLFYSSSRGLYLDAANASASAACASAVNANGNGASASISSPPRVRCAATGAWKRARPVTDDGGKSGS
jgi:hypothetical protein